MIIEKQYITPVEDILIKNKHLIRQAFNEIVKSICSVSYPQEFDIFRINNTEKNINGVVPIKEPCYIMLENIYGWYREKSLNVLKLEKQKGGPIDVYKEFTDNIENSGVIRVGLEFETGNISSAHRSMNKLMLGINRNELDLAVILMPVKQLSYYLTDRVANYEELEPYFENTDKLPFIFIGFNAEGYGNDVDPIPKGPDGMSHRSIRRWI